MTALLILIVAFMIIHVVWMMAITAMFHSNSQALKKFKETSEQLFGKHAEAIDVTCDALAEVGECMRQIDDVLGDYANETERMMKEAEKAKTFALDTIQEARRLVNLGERKDDGKEKL